MSLATARMRRRIYKDMPEIQFCIFIAIVILMIFILITNKHNSAGNAPVKEAGHSAQVKLIPTATLTPTPTLSDEQFIKTLPAGQIVWKTYGHESSYGKNDACKTQSLFNGFGFGQNKSGYYCYSSLREIATKVSSWFVSHLKTMTVKQALCYYNTGKILNTCDYAEYTLGL